MLRDLEMTRSWRFACRIHKPKPEHHAGPEGEHPLATYGSLGVA